MKGWTQRSVLSRSLAVLLVTAPVAYVFAAGEAPGGFDDQTNGFESQTQFDLDRAEFESREGVSDGLGPVYNAQSCAECHQNPVTGAGSQVSVIRAGRFDGANFVEHPGGSLINDRAIDASLQERVTLQDNVRTFRTSLSVLGDGYVEALPDSEFQRVQSQQPPNMKGLIIQVPVSEAPGTTRIARFGWKNQHASLLSFAADAYVNEMGITSPLQPRENTSNGNSVAAFDTVPDPEDAATSQNPFGTDVSSFVRFMRSTQPPPRDAALAAQPDAQAGERLFGQIGCAGCHTPTFTTAPAGTAVNGGTLVVPAALGSKVIHPFSDFMLHDVGTGDGIVQNGGPATRNRIRTPPLWGLRARARLMHDGESLTRNEAILRHGREADPVVRNFINLGPQQKNQLMAFLASL